MKVIKIFSKQYLNSGELYQDFVHDQIAENAIIDEEITVDEIKFFPIYLANIKKEKELFKLYLEAFKAMESLYLKYDREIVLKGDFWYSIMIAEFRSDIIDMYPEVLESSTDFKNIVIKKFDWENYIYKVLIGAQYICDNFDDGESRERYFRLIVQNLDVYNYIIKYEIFRNDKFLINVLDIIDNNNLSSLLKKKIRGREGLGDDERYGRRVIYEFNRSYPVIMSPMLPYTELEKYFLQFLSYYHDK